MASPPVAVTPLELGFDPSDAGFIADPYPVYRRLQRRASDPVEPRHPPVAHLAPRRRQPAAARPPAGPDVSPPVDPRGDGPARAARLARPVPRAQRRRACWTSSRPITRGSGGWSSRRSRHGPSRRCGRRIQAIVDGLIDDMGERRRGRPHRRLRRAAAGDGHRRAARHPRAADRHLLRPWSADFCLMYELDPPEASARKAVQASIEFGAYLRDLLAERRAPAGRRPHQRPRRGRRRRRHADRDRADRDLRPAPERRPRGVGQRRRERLVDAVPPSRRAGPAARRAGPPADRDRGAPAVRHAAVAVRALGPRADRGRRRRDPARRGGRAAVRVGEPRSRRPSSTRTVSTSRATRTRTCPSGPGSTTAWARRSPSWSSAIAFGTLLRRRAGARARRGAALEADLRPARARVAPGPALAAERRALRRARRLVHHRHLGPARRALAGAAGRGGRAA